jgi:hypothetical protein
MRKWLILLTTLVLLFPSPTQAQGTVTLDSLKVLLWAEYDQPSVLVIHDFTLTADTPVPTTMDIRLPKDANITAVAYQDPTGLVLANYQTQPEQDANWQVIKLFITERTNYHIEYYQPLGRNGNQRLFTYRWPGDFVVNNFDVEVQVPDDSTSVKTDPAIPLVQNQPFLSGGAMMSGLKEGQTYQLQLEYSRLIETAVVTPSSSQVEPVVPVDENTDGRSTLDNLPLFLGGFGVALILAALFYFFRSQSSPVRTAKTRRRSRSDPQELGMPSYCPECGTRSQEGDHFCRTCGSKLRGS